MTTPPPPSDRPVRQRPRQEGPRRVRNGLKLRRMPGTAPLAWLPSSWSDLLEARIGEIARLEGLEYARAGQVVSFVIEPDTGGAEPVARINATVQGRAARPYRTSFVVQAWTLDQWAHAVEAMAQEAIYSAKLLSGEVPQALNTLLGGMGRPLSPGSDETVLFECSCNGAMPCKHIAAVGLLLVERLAENPMIGFELRGISGETVIHRLQEARSILVHGRSAAHGSSPLTEPGQEQRPLETTVDEFWRPGSSFAEFECSPAQAYVPHALLRRLGPSPLQGRFPLVGLLASIYDEVRLDARRRQEDLLSEEVDQAPPPADHDPDPDAQDDVESTISPVDAT